MLHVYIVAANLLGSGFLSSALEAKTWNQDTRLDNPRNWREGKTPCARDRILFQPDPPLIVSLFSVSEMILPRNGELVFDTSETTSGTTCIGEDVFFRPHDDFWYQPTNWNITSEQAYPRTPSRRNAAVPHIFQVPCQNDDVVFPTTFQVQDLNPTPTVSAVIINGKSFDQAGYAQLVSSDTGRLLFPGAPLLNVQPQRCTDNRGCLCGNEEATESICKLVGPCPKVSCLDPISVTGHCCPICASRITGKYDSENFQMSRVLDVHSLHHDKETFQHVDSFVSLLKDGEIQSVYIDTTTHRKAHLLADIVYNTLVANPALYGIRSLKLEKSLLWNSPSHAFSSKGLPSGATAAIVIILFLSLAGIGIMYFYKRSQIPGFSFARFDLRGDRIELELGTTPHDELEPDGAKAEDSSTKEFDNPIYGEFDNKEGEIERKLSAVQDFVENPMYQIYEETSEDENKQ